MMRYSWSAVLLLVVGSVCHATPAKLASGGQAAWPIVVSDQASEATKASAATLADYLGKISGATFTVGSGDGATGIVLGTIRDWPALESAKGLEPADLTVRERYRLRSHGQGVYLLGASDAAVQHAVWDFLYRLGHRQFFPGPRWEVIPHTPELTIDVDVTEQPDYLVRRLTYGGGLWDYNREPYAQWMIRNRCASELQLLTGHAYGRIQSALRKEFEAHPEYLALVDGKRQGHKLCIGNPELRKLVVQYALDYFQKNPAAETISMEPSDGDGWCECELCAKLGTVSDQAVTLANEVAAAITASGEDRYVGMYAYNRHSPAPTISVHPRVVVSVATNFIRGGNTVEGLLDGWRARGAQKLGIREYHSVGTWDRDLPGASRAGNIDYLHRTIPDFYQRGARFYISECGDNWGPYGLGYYLSARMFWDVDEGSRIEALTADFLDKAFASARKPMAEFYRLLDGSHRVMLSDDLVGRMYRCLQQAFQAQSDPNVQARLTDLTLYVRYVDLYARYAPSRGAARQTAFEELARHVYRMRTSMMVHSKGFMRDVPERDRAVKVPADAVWKAPLAKNPWASNEPYASDEIAALVRQGVEQHPLMGFEPVAFDRQLVPTTALNLGSETGGSFGTVTRGLATWYTWVDRAPKNIELRMTGGLIAHYRDRGDATATLYEVASATGEASSQGATAPDGVERAVTLTAKDAGLHRIEVSDGHDATSLVWPDGLPMTREASIESPLLVQGGRASICFYVPRGTKMVGGYASGSGQIIDGQKQLRLQLSGKPGHFQIEVPKGQDGRVWRIEKLRGELRLMTVPPFVARNAAELLLPQEVIQTDAKASQTRK